ncbi:MAG: IS1634 family transposase [Acidobacteria bacterium]|nr:IS1634 family transposase [Acidobacteriota bacterium]
MASLQPFTSHGIRYWRIVESYRRRDGHPAVRNVLHLGKTDDVLARLQGTDPTAIRSVACGAVDAAAHLADELGIPGVLDAAIRTAGGRLRKRDGLTVGQSLTAAAIARLCHPSSKRAVAAWAATTSLPQWLRVDAAVLTSQHFWDQMDAVPVAALAEAELHVVERVLARETVPARVLAYDTTNFFTHVATTNEKNTLAQRGHNKQGRDNLRQLGLALVVAEEGHLPLGHVLYEGARPDVRTFAAVLAPLRARLTRLLPGPAQLTLVFDQGAESTANLAAVRAGGPEEVTHYVTALKPSAHRAWLADAVPHLTEVTLSSGEVVRAARARWPVHGVEQTVVIVWSARLAAGQRRGVEQALTKAVQRLTALSPHPRGGRPAMEQRAARICQRQYLRQFLSAEVGEADGNLIARPRIDETARRRLETEYLGLRVLATNRDDWTTAQIIEAYRGQAHVERVFRDLKDPWVGAFRPQFHWTDQKIRVHALIVVLGLLLGRVLLRRAQQRVGFQGSLRTLIGRLALLRRATLVYAPKGTKGGRPRIVEQLEHGEDEELARLVAALNIPVAYTRSPR